LRIPGFRHTPIVDLILQQEMGIAIQKKYDAFRCPGMNYKGSLRKTIDIIRQHLRDIPRDIFTTPW
jgi:hypothetical protein